MNILSDAIEFMYRANDKHPEVSRLADPRLVEEAIEKKEQLSCPDLS